jgi:hypothetical protein
LVAIDNGGILSRRLPAQQVARLVIALGLHPCVTSSATTQARPRLGTQPLERRFKNSAQQWTAHDEAPPERFPGAVFKVEKAFLPDL